MKYLIFAVIGAILTVQSAVAADKKLTISVYSFAQDAYKKALYDPFEEICECKLVIKTGNRRADGENRSQCGQSRN